MWIKAVKNKEFDTWPYITGQLIKKHLPPAVATAKVHMDQNRKDMRSTKTDNSPTLDEDDLFPKKHPTKTNNTFLGAATIDVQSDKSYINLTGRFPVGYLHSMQYILVLYHYDSNAILIEPMKNRTDAKTYCAYKKLYGYL